MKPFDRYASRQDYPTPIELIHAVEARFGPIVFDLAANQKNAKAPQFFTKKDDAFSFDWHAIPRKRNEILWLNPPFADIAPWAKKCADEAAQGARIAMLVPASVGSLWARDHVFGATDRCCVDIYFLRGRVRFSEKNAFPADCMLVLYSPPSRNRPRQGTVEVWNWREEILLSDALESSRIVEWRASRSSPSDTKATHK